MKKICLCFQVHQPMQLKRYRFFNMGRDIHYLDDYANRKAMREAAQKCYLPMNELLLNLIEKHGDKFKVSFAISSLTIEQMAEYAPEALESFKKLASTGGVEFVASPYSWSLSSLASSEVFRTEIERNSEQIVSTFGQKPKSFVNSEMIYSDRIGEIVAEQGFTSMLTEGAKHILGWKSPNYVYANSENPRLKVLLRNASASDDIRYSFSGGITAESYTNTIENTPGDINTIFVDYNTFGMHHTSESGIFDFFKYFVNNGIAENRLEFTTPTLITDAEQPVAVLHVPYTVSWADEERDTSAWLGNQLQNEAFGKLYRLQMKVAAINNDDMNRVWDFMSSTNNFYYMSTKWFAGDVGHRDNPFGSPYEAFINYMNVFSDFEREVNARYERGQESTATVKSSNESEGSATKAKPATKRATKSTSTAKAAKAAKPATKSTTAKTTKTATKRKTATTSTAKESVA